MGCGGKNIVWGVVLLAIYIWRKIRYVFFIYVF